jgi:hypothetical protein
VRALLVLDIYPLLLDILDTRDGLGISKMMADLLGENQFMPGSGAFDPTSTLSV